MTLRLTEKEFAARFPDQAQLLDAQAESLDRAALIETMIREGEQLPEAPTSSRKKTFVLYVLMFLLGYMAAELRYAVSMFFIF